MLQIVLTPAAGKRLIGRAVARHPAIETALVSGTIVIIAGTTNGYVAEEILKDIGQAGEFSRKRFFRGITLPSGKPAAGTGRLPDESAFPGDVIIRQGQWLRGKTIFDIVDELGEGDVILKGANALDVERKRAAVLIGHPRCGTIGAALSVVCGRRVRLLMPAGLEKRIAGNLDEIAVRTNAPGAAGPRLLPVPGEVITEIEAVFLLTGATAEMVAAGGVCGAEGAIWLAVRGNEYQEKQVNELFAAVAGEPAFVL